MISAFDCVPCFKKMAYREACLAFPDNAVKQQEIVSEWNELLATLDLTLSPPAIARYLNQIVRRKTGGLDIYSDDKKQSNGRAAQLMPQLEALLVKERTIEGGDPLGLALEIAIIGNYIDRGVALDIDWERELTHVSQSLDSETMGLFHASLYADAHVLILGDNAGEIVLDKLLVRELKRAQCRVTYVVRSFPVINDATMEDAISVGMTDLCPVIASGVDTPGTVLDRCSQEFLDMMRSADVILSKGQGNFEALEGVVPGVFCAFKVKCDRVSRDTGLEFGHSAFRLTRDSSLL